METHVAQELLVEMTKRAVTHVMQQAGNFYAQNILFFRYIVAEVGVLGLSGTFPPVKCETPTECSKRL